MQFYKNGFRGGNPDIQEAAPNRRNRGAHEPLPSEVDVLIAGTGPAGLCLAAQLAQFPEINTMVVERMGSNIIKGKADGINTRTMEMFQAFGFADKVKRETYWVNQTAFWMPDPQKPEHIKRVGRVQDVADDSSEMPHILINQARLHELFLEVMQNSPSRLQPDYGWEIAGVARGPETEAFPLTVTLRDAIGLNWGGERVVKAKYVVGCNGAHSAVRKAIGVEMRGDAAHQAWGVMDILANTDFPDVRQKCLISSAHEGNVLILPREGGYIFRMYVELDKLRPNERAAQRQLTQADLIAAAQRIISPYSLDIKEVVWWSIYDIGHAIADRFDDAPDSQGPEPRVFIAGDACHTHSPKAGQGMNVSMQDAFNLGWKLAHVLRSRAAPQLLRSYSQERLEQAKVLIDTDHKWSRVMSAPTTEAERAGTEEPRIIRQFKENLPFTGGIAVRYAPSSLTDSGVHQMLATGQTVGMRFHSAPVVRVADALPMQLGHVAQADGRWRIYAFAGDGDDGSPGKPMHQLATWLETDPMSPVLRHTRADEDIDAVIDFRAVFGQTFDQLAVEKFAPLLKPKTGRLGLQDHEKAFCVAHKGEGNIYEMRGIDQAHGCLVVVRPDQYVAHVLPLDARAELADFFAQILHAVR